MNVTLFATVLLTALVAAVPGRADDSFALGRASIVALGPEGGDTFGLEHIDKDQVVVLLQPRGEDCTLRFPLSVGETLRLRSGPGGSAEDLVCEASLLSIDTKARTQFSAKCSMQAASNERKCPPQSQEASTPLPGLHK